MNALSAMQKLLRYTVIGYLFYSNFALGNESYLINLPTANINHHLFRVAHRFNGQVEQDTEASSAGMDNGAMIRLGFDYVFSKDSQLGISRTSWTGNLESSLKQRLYQSENWSMTIVGSTNLETGLKEKRDGTGNSINAQWIIQRNHHQFMWLLSALYATNSNPIKTESTSALATGGWYQVDPMHKISVEIIKPVIGYLGDNDYPLTSLGWHWQSGAHIFKLVVSNSIQLNTNRVIATDGIQDARQFHLGFSVNRYF